MAIFPVSEVSFHQVAEVTGDLRLSISGWYHFQDDDHDDAAGAGERPEKKKSGSDDDGAARKKAPLAGAKVAPVEPPRLQPAGEGIALKDWVSAQYLNKAMQNQIRDAFMEQSSIQLSKFLTPAAQARVLAEVGAAAWVPQGPHHQRWYERCAAASSLEPVLLSTAFGEFLTAVTGLNLVGGSLQVRRFGRGHYTLLRDELFTQCAVLDVTLGLTPDPKSWDPAWGGHMTYVSSDEALLSEEPSMNSLSIVYRRTGVAPFVKFLNSSLPPNRKRIDVFATYLEPEDERNAEESQSESGEGSGDDDDDAGEGEEEQGEQETGEGHEGEAQNE